MGYEFKELCSVDNNLQLSKLLPTSHVINIYMNCWWVTECPWARDCCLVVNLTHLTLFHPFLTPGKLLLFLRNPSSSSNVAFGTLSITSGRLSWSGKRKDFWRNICEFMYKHISYMYYLYSKYILYHVLYINTMYILHHKNKTNGL